MKKITKATKKEKLREGQKVAGIAIYLEGTLAVAKIVIGLLSGSVVLMSDAVHSASDMISVATSWIGLKIAQKKPDKKFPFGYYKAENLGAAFISFLILFAAWEMLTRGYASLFSFSSIKVPYLALAISFSDAIILFFFGRYEIKIGEKVGARSLISMGKENKTHIFSSMAVFFGILAAWYKIPYFEGIITMGIAFLIFKIGFTTAKDSIFALMDVSPDKEIEKKVTQAIMSVPGIEDFYGLRLREAGPFIFGETKVGIRKFVDIDRAHEISRKVEEEVEKRVPQIDSFTIHVEPFKTNFCHLVIPLKEKKGLSSSLSKNFGRASYFLFVNLKNKQIKGYYFLKNPYKDKKVRAGLAASKMIAEQKSDTLLIDQVGEISFYALRDNLIDIYRVETKTAKEAIALFNKRKLIKLKKPTKEKD